MICDFFKFQQECTRTKLVAFYGLVLSAIFLFLYLKNLTALLIVGLALLFCSILFFSEREIFLLLSFLMPNLFMYKSPGGEAAFLGYFVMILGLKYLYQHFFSIRLNPYLVFHFCVCILTFLYWDDSRMLLSVIRFFSSFFLFESLANSIKEREIPLVLDFFLFGAVVAIITGIIYRTNQGTLLNGLFAGINSDRNYFTAAVSPMFCIVLILLMKENNGTIKKIFYFISIIIYFLCLILAASRTAVIALVFPILFILSYFSILRENILNIKKIFLPLFMLLLVALFLFFQYGDSIDFLINRFYADDMKTGSGRFELWQFYIEETIKNPISLLIGRGSSFELFYHHVEHNSVLQCFNRTGLLGLMSLFGVFSYSIANCIQNVKKIQMSAFLPLCVVFFVYTGINALHDDQLSFLFVMCLLVVKYLENYDKSYIEKKNSRWKT